MAEVTSASTLRLFCVLKSKSLELVKVSLLFVEHSASSHFHRSLNQVLVFIFV